MTILRLHIEDFNIGIAGGFVFIVAALALNHSGEQSLAFAAVSGAALLVGLFFIAAATPAALGLLADISESFPQDRGVIMGMYSVFLAVGQIIGAMIGAGAAELFAFDGILMASFVLQVVALLPISRLRRFELAFEPTPASAPDPAVTIDLSMTGAHRPGTDEESGGG